MNIKTYIAGLLGALALALFSASASAAFPASGCGTCHAVPTAGGAPDTCSATFDAAKQQLMSTNAAIFGATITPEQIAAEVEAQCGGGTITTTSLATTAASTTTTTHFPIVCETCHAMPYNRGDWLSHYPNGANACASNFYAFNTTTPTPQMNLMAQRAGVDPMEVLFVTRELCGWFPTTTPPTTTSTDGTTSTTSTGASSTTTSSVTTTTTDPVGLPTFCSTCHGKPTIGGGTGFPGSPNLCTPGFNICTHTCSPNVISIWCFETCPLGGFREKVAALCSGTTTSTAPLITTTLTSTTTTTASGGNGQALYNSFCAGCHSGDALPANGRNIDGARVCSIKGALNGTKVFPTGVPQMAFLKSVLNDTQIQAISDYLNSGSVTGQQRYITACAGCHGVDARGGRVGESVRGENAAEISEAIYDESAMRFLNCLPEGDVGAIGGYLSGSAYSTTTRYATTTTRRSTTTTGSVTTTTKRCSRYDRRCNGKPHRDRDDG